jgi:hypothetical protein
MLEKHLSVLEAAGENDVYLEERALDLAIEEMFEQTGEKWKPWARNVKLIRVGEIILLVDSDTVVQEVSVLFVYCLLQGLIFIRTVSEIQLVNSLNVPKWPLSSTNQVSYLDGTVSCQTLMFFYITTDVMQVAHRYSFFFFGGLSIHLSIALLTHMFSYNMTWTWGATKKVR